MKRHLFYPLFIVFFAFFPALIIVIFCYNAYDLSFIGTLLVGDVIHKTAIAKYQYILFLYGVSAIIECALFASFALLLLKIPHVLGKILFTLLSVSYVFICATQTMFLLECFSYTSSTAVENLDNIYLIVTPKNSVVFALVCVFCLVHLFYLFKTYPSTPHRQYSCITPIILFILSFTGILILSGRSKLTNGNPIPSPCINFIQTMLTPPPLFLRKKILPLPTFVDAVG